MIYNLRTLKNADVAGKTVVVRANLDVALDQYGEIIDDTRIRASIPTYEYLLKKKCKIVIIGHLGRPQGKYDEDLSLFPVRFALGKLLGKQIKFAQLESCQNSIKYMNEGEITMIENLRFDPREESTITKERREYIKILSELCDIYVNDCFGVYKKHASVFDLPQMIPSYAGLSLINEIENLTKVLSSSKSPSIAILGGAKVSDKIKLISKFMGAMDKILLGGPMAYTFLKAQGVDMGNSKIDENALQEAIKILDLSKKKKTEIILPIDHIAGDSFTSETAPIEVPTQKIPDGLIGLDIGPKTIIMYREIIESAQTVIWNGPMGVFGWESFSKGTESIGEFIALSTPKDAFKVAGGGDTLAAIKKLKINPKRFNHVSVGGGMLLKFLAGEKLEVLEILSE
jgi:phosphoglycerate kinase